MEFFATCPKGFERFLGDELSTLGCGQIRPLKGQVSFTGETTELVDGGYYLVNSDVTVSTRIEVSGTAVHKYAADEIYTYEKITLVPPKNVLFDDADFSQAGFTVNVGKLKEISEDLSVIAAGGVIK